MVRYILSIGALGLCVACQPTVPESGAPFDPAASAQRDTELAQTQSTVPPPASVEAQPLDGASAADPAAAPLPASVTAAVNGQDAAQEAQAAQELAAANSGVAPVQASPSNPAPTPVSNPGISSEQNFDAVSAERSIESDAQRLAQNRAQYTVIAPTDLPKRPGTNQPNIVEYALRTTNPVGAQVYSRTNLRSAQRHAAACGRFASSDQAQTEFLSRGGPQRDRGGLDPDGDGFACSWDPAPFRKARAASQLTPEGQAGGAPIADPLAISTE